MRPMTDDERVARAEKAAKLLDEPLLVEAWDVLEREFLEHALRDSDDARRVKFLASINVLRGVRDLFSEYVVSGKLASNDIHSIADAREVQKRGWFGW